ncbi:MAG: lipoprotein [Planctomycetota bacterium]|jgi:predicted small lipoprotein YifL
MKSIFKLAVFFILIFAFSGCVVGPLPPSEDMGDPQQASTMSTEGRWRQEQMREIEYMKAEEERSHKDWDSEDYRLDK